MKERKEYILGTDQAELYRLGLQHQVWAEEAYKSWRWAGFTQGDTILDLGCGPGFCSIDLAYIVGAFGKVIGVDMAQNYIDFLARLNQTHNLNIELICSSFEAMVLEDNSLDGVYDRWALAWVESPKPVLSKLFKACKSGASLVFHEYYDWSIFQMEPHMPALHHGIQTILTHFKNSNGEIDIGRKLSEMLEECGFVIQSTQPMAKLATPDSLSWHWPKSFLHIYLPKLVPLGLISQTAVEDALEEFEKLENTPGASILCPQLIEVIAVKP
jgi:ubiquinone/menaquinone biosynthesis C-methylase UbiE